VGTTDKKVTFVVATKDRHDDLRTMLKSLAEQSRRPDQIIIVDSSTEKDAGVGEEFPSLNIRYIHHDRPSASRRRNVGVRAVDDDTDLIGFLDDDAVLLPGAMEAMLKFWETGPPDLGGCSFNDADFKPSSGGGLNRLPCVRWLGLYSKEGGRVMPSGWQTLIGSVNEDTFVEWLPTTAAVWRREVFDEFMFDEYFDGYSYLEDLDFSFSVGKHYRLAVVADAGFRHYPSPSGRTGAYRFGQVEARNRLYIVKKHGLSLWRCYLGLLIRLGMTMGSAARGGGMAHIQRALGNCAAIARSLIPIRESSPAGTDT